MWRRRSARACARPRPTPLYHFATRARFPVPLAGVASGPPADRVYVELSIHSLRLGCLCYIFEFYYDTYSRNWKLTDGADDYQAVKKAMIDRFESVTGSEEHIRRAVSSRLNQNDLLRSLNEMDRCFDKAAFNAEAKFGLLRNAVMAHADVAQFVYERCNILYRSPGTYDELRKAIKDFDGGRKAFVAVQSLSQPQQIVPKSILQRPDRLQRSNMVEEKVDMLGDKLAELSLLMKKKDADQLSLDTRTCSFCKGCGAWCHQMSVESLSYYPLS